MTRRKHWERLLATYVHELSRSTFQYGFVDCGLYVAGAIEVMTGLDIKSEVPDLSYTDEIGAALALKRAGFEDVEDMAEKLASKYGFPEVHPNFAGRGDVLLAYNEGDILSLALCLGDCIIGPSKEGFAPIPRRECLRAWQI